MTEEPTIERTVFFIDKDALHANQESGEAGSPAVCVRTVVNRTSGGRKVQDIQTKRKANEIVLRCPCCEIEVARFRSDYRPKERGRDHPLQLSFVNVWVETENAEIEIVGESDEGPW